MTTGKTTGALGANRDGLLTLESGGYSIDILVPGFPGKSRQNGGLGWSTVVLLRGHQRIILIDTGTFGLRKALREKLAERGILPEDVTDVLLSHAHYDHIVNFPMFPNARIAIGRQELQWAAGVRAGTGPVAELYVSALLAMPELRLMDHDQEILPGITAYLAPGHTPGHLVFVLEGEESDVIFVQDAAKTKAELVSRVTDMTYDPAISRTTVEYIWSLWQRRPCSILVPGHDMPLVLGQSGPQRLGRSQAGVTAVFGDDLSDVTDIPFDFPDATASEIH